MNPEQERELDRVLADAKTSALETLNELIDVEAGLSEILRSVGQEPV